MRACGYDDESAFYSGVRVDQMRFIAYIGSGVFTGLAGSALSIPLGAFVSNMSGGRGWLALVAVIMGEKEPLLVVVSAVMLGFCYRTLHLPASFHRNISKLLLSLPYFASLISLLSHTAEERRSTAFVIPNG